MTDQAAAEAASISVLVVEDDELVRRMLVRVLERRGFVTHEASSGAVALEMVDRRHVDVVLLDNGLPDMAGTDVLSTLRQSPTSATLPVILVTGQADIQARVGGLQAGADDYLVKPVNMDELVARVHAQIRGRDAWRSQVQEKLHERARVAVALAAIPADEGTQATAVAIADVLADIPAVASVGVIEFSPDGSAVVLATTRGGFAVLSPALVGELRREVADGATVLSPAVAGAVVAVAHDRVVAAPVVIGGRVVATVLLATALGSAGDARSVSLEVLSAAIDLSPVIHRVLSAALESSHGSEPVSTRLREIIAGAEFHPVFQPLVHLGEQRVTGFEALTRFEDGVPPDRRFAEAAHLGLGLDLEIATMRSALAASHALPSGCYLSLNVSSSLLTSGELPAVLAEANGRQLVLELTEHERIDDYAAVLEVLESFGPNLRWSVDDAGSGWSSLSHVFSLRPHFVKLDRAWVSGIDQDPARQALLLGIGRFVEALDGDLVAEGIETDAELSTLSALEIRYGQGYLLGRPAPVDQLDLPG